ncbi:MAG: Calx-beta domain-containing protein [Cyanobacteria bacterium P01_F01_bin.143]
MEELSTISIGAATLTVNEDIGEIIIPLTRIGNTELAASLDYSINNNSARSGQDFIGTSGAINFAPGETNQEITVTIVDDNIFETAESFSLAIGNPTGAILGDIRTATIIIEDNDVIGENTVTFSQEEYSVLEADDAATITVVRTGNVNQTVSVDYNTSDDSARAGLDYTAVSGTLTFAPGQTTKTFDIPLLDDSLPETNEALTINLSNATGIGLGLQQTATLTIEEDDELPFSFDREVVVALDSSSRLVTSDGGFEPGPTAFDWSPDGTMFIAKLNGVVQVFDGNNLLDEPFIDLSAQVNTGGQRGLLGLAVHPEFPQQPYVYLAFSYDPPDAIPDQSGVGRVTRLVRYTADPNSNYQTALPNSEVILLETPPVQNFHAAGAIRFGNNGELFFSHGDGTQVSGSPTPEQAVILQSIDNPFGKLFRIDPITGNGFADNPFYDGDLTSIESKVYDYGLRNPWRFAIHPETGEPFIGDVGWTNWEEINTGKGNNFGWPLYEGGNGVSLRTTALAEDPEFQNLYETQSSITAPILGISHNNGGRSLVVGDFYTGVVYPDIYQGALFIADFNSFTNGVDAVTFDAQGNIDSILNFTEERTITQIAMGPDSHLYFSNLVTGEIGRWVFNSPLPDTATNGDDLIIGTEANDTIRSLDGDDVLSGGQGDDRLIGNEGDDTIAGEAGFDSLHGWSGNDLLFGNDGNDRLFGYEDNDKLIGGSGEDELFGGQDDDRLIGNDGDDTIRGDDGSDILNGGSGNDLLFGNDGNDRLFGGDGQDTLKGGHGEDELFGDQGDDRLIGNDGDDTIRGGAGFDSLNGGSGNDSLVGNEDNDRIFGSDGQDTLKGGSGEDQLVAGPGNDLISGGIGDDSLNGGIGNDTLVAGHGDDRLIGGDGADLFLIESTEGRNFISDFELGIDLLGIADDIELDELKITNNWNNTGTIIFDNLNRSLMILGGINPESLDLNRDFI